MDSCKIVDTIYMKRWWFCKYMPREMLGWAATQSTYALVEHRPVRSLSLMLITAHVFYENFEALNYYET